MHVEVGVVDRVEGTAAIASVGWEARGDLAGGRVGYQQGDREEESEPKWIPAFAGMTDACGARFRPRHPRGSGGPRLPGWIPAFAGMTVWRIGALRQAQGKLGAGKTTP